MGRKIKHWWTDGVDMQEWLALFFCITWAGVAIVMSVKSYNIGLDVEDNDFFWSVSWPTIIASASYFGVKLAINLGQRSFSSRSNNQAEPPLESLTKPPDKDVNWRDYV